MIRSAGMRVLLLSTAAVLIASAGRADHHEKAETSPPGAAEAGKKGGDPVLDAINAFIEKQGIDTSGSGWKLGLPEPPVQSFETGKSYLWELDTSKGPIVIKLMPEVAPMHATSTIYLTQLGFYDDTVFHRVIPGFMAQGGDPRGNGTGGPGYSYDGELDPNVKHDRPGLLSMANRGPGTDGSQFFITFAPTPWLDGRHTLFGEVVSGMETLGELEKYGTEQGRTTEKFELRKASIRVE